MGVHARDPPRTRRLSPQLSELSYRFRPPLTTSSSPLTEHTDQREAFRFAGVNEQMRTVDTRRYEMLVRVRDFGEAHQDLFPESSRAREQFAIVAATVSDLGQYAVTRMSAQQAGGMPRVAAREVLIERLEAMSLTARAMEGDVPGMAEKFRIRKARGDQA